MIAAIHEVIAQDGTCLYRGSDVELACEVYGAAPAEARLLCRQLCIADDRRRQDEAAAMDLPVPYALTMAGYAAAAPVDAQVPYALTERAAELFVVDTTDVSDLRRRCPDLFAPRPNDAA